MRICASHLYQPYLLLMKNSPFPVTLRHPKKNHPCHASETRKKKMEKRRNRKEKMRKGEIENIEKVRKEKKKKEKITMQ
jgi:hypothetical protein